MPSTKRKRRADQGTENLTETLLASISHDLKTPLAAVYGAAAMLRNRIGKTEDGELTDLISIIIDESERLNRFLINISQITKFSVGVIHPDIAMYDLSEIVGTAIQRASKLITHHRFELMLTKELPLVRLDAVLFEQVLFNLLDNAAKYSPKGTMIRIQGFRERETICLEVSDEGHGILVADLERIFDKFYRGKMPEQACAGTGLGLAICRGFIEAMGGTIRASNRVERSGAVFKIVMPCRGTKNRDGPQSIYPAISS